MFNFPHGYWQTEFKLRVYYKIILPYFQCERNEYFFSSPAMNEIGRSQEKEIGETITLFFLSSQILKEKGIYGEP